MDEAQRQQQRGHAGPERPSLLALLSGHLPFGVEGTRIGVWGLGCKNWIDNSQFICSITSTVHRDSSCTIMTFIALRGRLQFLYNPPDAVNIIYLYIPYMYRMYTVYKFVRVYIPL